MPLHEEVSKRYLAYALSTIVSRALPDVRDGLKPVHRRILYAMNGMGLSDAARMRKSAAVVGEVIGKYHPHGDQAAYDALVRMAQDFSLRYPLIDGSGNFGSVDGDSPAAMRYTETRLSAFAGLLLREIDQGTTDFEPTYDAMGKEPLVLPAGVPNLLVNGASGIAVGMSCSFPPHNLAEVIEGCRAAIKDEKIGVKALLEHIKGPDFPTAGEILDQPDALAEIYEKGHGSVRVRGTFTVETGKRGKESLIITSIPYSVNKSRLIERIAHLVKFKGLKQVQDVRDESAEDIRIVLELKGDARPETIMAFIYRHSDLQVNYPINFIAITPAGVPERLSLDRIIRSFLDFRFEVVTRRLEHQLAILRKRIHILEGFARLFGDLDRALRIIRNARSRKEAADGLKDAFDLDDEQVDAILEMRLYKLVGMEMGRLMDELAAKKREANAIEKDLSSPKRLWKLVDGELAEIGKKFGDARLTRFVAEQEAPAVEYDPEEFVEHEDVTVILSRQGWIRRQKATVEDPAGLKFREGDALFGTARVSTDRTLALFSNLGKVYVIRVLDIPAVSGFGEPLGSILTMDDGEVIVGMIAPDPAVGSAELRPDRGDEESAADAATDGEEDLHQAGLFDDDSDDSKAADSEDAQEGSPSATGRGFVITRRGQGFRFDYEGLREPTKRIGRRFVTLRTGDETLVAKPEEGELFAVAESSGNLLIFPAEETSILSGPAQGVRMIKLKEGQTVVAADSVGPDDRIRIESKRGKEIALRVGDQPISKRDTRGRSVATGVASMERLPVSEDQGE